MALAMMPKLRCSAIVCAGCVGVVSGSGESEYCMSLRSDLDVTSGSGSEVEGSR